MKSNGFWGVGVNFDGLLITIEGILLKYKEGMIGNLGIPTEAYCVHVSTKVMLENLVFPKVSTKAMIKDF